MLTGSASFGVSFFLADLFGVLFNCLLEALSKYASLLQLDLFNWDMICLQSSFCSLSLFSEKKIRIQIKVYCQRDFTYFSKENSPDSSLDSEVSSEELSSFVLSSGKKL